MNWDYSIFLAHAKEDKEQVRNIYKKLKGAGLSPWLDEEKLLPGVDWDMEIRDAVKKSRFFIAFISSNSIEKTGYYQRELRMALSHMEERPPETVYIIPALLSDISIPDITVGTVNLSRFQAVRLFPPHEEKEFRRLKQALTKEIKQLAKKTTFPRLVSQAQQLSLFPVPKKEILKQYGHTILKRIAPYVNYDPLKASEFQPWQVNEIAFFASIENFANAIEHPPLVDYLLESLPHNVLDFDDLFFDIHKLEWRSFSEISEEYTTDGPLFDLINNLNSEDYEKSEIIEALETIAEMYNLRVSITRDRSRNK